MEGCSIKTDSLAFGPKAPFESCVSKEVSRNAPKVSASIDCVSLDCTARPAFLKFTGGPVLREVSREVRVSRVYCVERERSVPDDSLVYSVAD